jgi:hypothetical protein
MRWRATRKRCDAARASLDYRKTRTGPPQMIRGESDIMSQIFRCIFGAISQFHCHAIKNFI